MFDALDCATPLDEVGLLGLLPLGRNINAGASADTAASAGAEPLLCPEGTPVIDVDPDDPEELGLDEFLQGFCSLLVDTDQLGIPHISVYKLSQPLLTDM